jgi:hypothetical protein
MNPSGKMHFNAFKENKQHPCLTLRIFNKTKYPDDPVPGLVVIIIRLRKKAFSFPPYELISGLIQHLARSVGC